MSRFRHSMIGWGAVSVVALSIAVLPATARANDLELGLRLGVLAPTEPEDTLSPVGVSGGPFALLRLGDHFALGGTVDASWVGWDARGDETGVVMDGLGFPDADGSVQVTLMALVTRWYFVAPSRWQPYLELGLGYLSVTQTPAHPDCGDGSGPSAQLALGLDWAATSWVRIGAMGSVRPFRMGFGCSSNAYPGRPADPPHGRLAIAGQLAVTSVWSQQ